MTGNRVSSWQGHDEDALRERWDRDGVHLFGSVTSTMDVARSLAEEEDAADGTIVLAREQTEGRGRGDREWHSPPGGLYLSMVFRPREVPNPAILPVLAGLGIAREFDHAWPHLPVLLKWPNDLLASGGKLGGVLCEAVSGEEGVRFLVVGVGVNVEAVEDELPGGLAADATSLSTELGEAVDPVEAADAVVRGLEAYLPEAPARLDTHMLELVDEFDALRDRRVTVRLPEEDEPLPGMCVGIAPDGKLLFRPDRGALRRLDRGDVELVKRA